MSAAVAEFVEALRAAFADVGVSGEQCEFDEASGQLVLAGETTRVVPVAALFPRYAECADGAARTAFIEATAAAFGEGAADVPSDYADCGARLLPQLWAVEKIAARQCTLPSQHQLPHCGVHGEDPPLKSGNAFDGHTLGVVLVCEYIPAAGAAGAIPAIETPVLSSDLARWGVSFVEALRLAVENLRERTKKGPPPGERFEHHESGCATSLFRDRFDAARCALFPTLVAKRKTPGGQPVAGGHIVAFPATSCVLAATSKNALGLCFLGDTMHLKIVAEDARTKANQVLTTTPYRLLKMKDPSKAASSSDSAPAPAKHPLHQQAGEGFVWRWRPYTPGGPPLQAAGEFSVPIDQEEVDGILNAIEAGRPVPVFAASEPKAAPKPGSDGRFAAKKEEANALFKAGDYVKALAAYDAAVAAGPPCDADAAIAHANAAQALLNLATADPERRDACAAEALRRAHTAAELDPTYPKAHARCAAACDILGEADAARDFRVKAEAATAARAATDSAAKAVQRVEAEAKRAEAEAKRKAREEQQAAQEKVKREAEARAAILERERALELQKDGGASGATDAELASKAEEALRRLDPSLVERLQA